MVKDIHSSDNTFDRDNITLDTLKSHRQEIIALAKLATVRIVDSSGNLLFHLWIPDGRRL